MSAASLVFPFPAGVNVGSPSLDQGIDYSAPAHTPELAVESGTVYYQSISGFGPNVAVLKGDSGQIYYYGHAGPGGEVKPGTHVTAGTQIAEVGAGIVGTSTGPHLEIGLSNALGIPIGRQSAPGLLAQLRGASHVNYAGGAISGGSSGAGGGGILGSVGGALGSAAGAVGSVAGAAAGVVGDATSGLASGIVNSIFGWVGPKIVKFLLYAVFIFGGVILAGYGISKMIGVNPVTSAAKGAGNAKLLEMAAA